jgi:hypothetical protein
MSMSFVSGVFVILVLLLLAERPAHAYIDPGTGSMIYQTVLTVALGLGFVLRRTIASLLQSVRSRFGTREPAPPGQHSDSL